MRALAATIRLTPRASATFVNAPLVLGAEKTKSRCPPLGCFAGSTSVSPKRIPPRALAIVGRSARQRVLPSSASDSTVASPGGWR